MSFHIIIILNFSRFKKINIFILLIRLVYDSIINLYRFIMGKSFIIKKI